jgi:2-polyprenyl-3-methyl-5-hydroxy-6-metoxy-1,4-benzoquinol methylase
MIEIKNCQICNGNNFLRITKTKDYSTSKEEFIIVKCQDCEFLFTNPRVKEEKIGEYYKSDKYISHTNSNKGLFNFLYQTVRKYAIKTKTKLLLNSIGTKKHLDVGCGTGEFLNACNVKNIECIGIEPSEIARNNAIKNYNLDIRSETNLNQFNIDEFDSVSMWHVLEHVYDLNKTIKHLNRIIRNNGVLIIAVPNHKSLDAKKYKNYWAAWDVPIHVNHFSPTTITNLMSKYNFTLKNKIGMKFDSFYVSLLSSEYRSGRKQYIEGFLMGVISNISAMLGFTEYSSTIYIFKNKK